jgi:hypothetical protein
MKMTLYEIEQQILSCVDTETGEVIDFEKLDSLELERDRKIENIGLWIKNLEADAKAYKAEKDSFAQKQKSAENKAKYLKEYLNRYLDGTAFKSTRLSISFRTSKSTEVFDINALLNYRDSEIYLKYADPEPNLTEIKEAIKDGVEIPGCRIIESRNIQIK